MSEIPREENIKQPESAKDAFFRAYGLPTDPEHMEEFKTTSQFGNKNKLVLLKATLPSGEKKYYFSSGQQMHIDLAYAPYEALIRDGVIKQEEYPSFEAVLKKYSTGEQMVFQFALGFLIEPDKFIVRESTIPEVTVKENP